MRQPLAVDRFIQKQQVPERKNGSSIPAHSRSTDDVSGPDFAGGVVACAADRQNPYAVLSIGMYHIVCVGFVTTSELATAMPNTIDVGTWREFRESLYRFAQMDRERRNHWWFRGHSRSSYRLEPTIDRHQQFDADSDREKAIATLLREYRREVITLGYGDNSPLDDSFELLARHHGLPSPLLDWTRSPWVASFFAFRDADVNTDGEVVVFGLDRSRVDSAVLQPQEENARPRVEWIDNPELVRVNPRAQHQRGVFVRRSTIHDTLEALLQPALTAFRLPATEKKSALRDLDQMLLNDTSLMYDLDAAARTATWRLA